MANLGMAKYASFELLPVYKDVEICLMLTKEILP